MNQVEASCGHLVPAAGTPNSRVRKAQKRSPCQSPRCQSRLPVKFTDAECEAYVWLIDAGVRPWLVDLVTKEVNTWSRKYASLIHFARSKGWTGGLKL